MLKILQDRLQQYLNCEFPDVQAGFRKGRGTRDKGKTKRIPGGEKKIYCFNDCTKPFDSVDHNKLWKILQEVGIPDNLICLPRSLFADQVATVRIRHEKMDWFQIEKGVCQGCILSPCLFNLDAENIMWNSRLAEAQAGIKIARINIINL